MHSLRDGGQEVNLADANTNRESRIRSSVGDDRATMSFKKGFSRGAQSAISKPASGGGATISGFSFKQLEEDEDDEDLTAFTGKYDALVGESQRTHKKGHERTPSNSSVSSTSSAPGEIKSTFATEGGSDGVKVLLKASSSVPLEPSNSPARVAARAKFETSKELFSGLKGKITDKISKTIEEFSGESSSSLSPDKEVPGTAGLVDNITLVPGIIRSVEKEVFKQVPSPAVSCGLVERYTVTPLHSSAPTRDTSYNNHKLENQGVSFTKDSENTPELKEAPSVLVKDVPSSARAKATSAPAKESLHLSSFVEEHPLAKVDTEDDFEDVTEPFDAEPLPRVGHSINDDVSEFYDPHDSETSTNIQVFEEHFTTEPTEDFTGHPAFMTTTQLKPRSKIKRLIKKREPKTCAVATMSGLHYTPDEEIASSFEAKPVKTSKELEEKIEEKLMRDEKTVSASTESTSGLLLRQFSFEGRGLVYQKLCVVTVVLFAYLIVPMPSYISGFIMGSLLASLGWSVYIWLVEPPRSLEPVILPPLELHMPVPEMKLSSEGEEFLYKGWMNELTDYSHNDYHISKTHTVFVSLEGSHLRLQRPKNAIAKRAMWDEVLPKPQFIHQRHFDLVGSHVYLLPQGLVKKRIWSKKYPICVALSWTEDIRLRHTSSEPVMAGKKEKLSDMGFEFVTEDKCEHSTLYLFARTGREKEDWFKRLAAAAAGKPLGNHVLEMKRAVSQSSTVMKKSSDPFPRNKREGSTESVDSSSSLSDIQAELAAHKEAETLDLVTFAHYMGRLMPAGSLSRASSPTHSAATNKEVTTSKNATSSSSRDTEEIRVLSPSGPIICDSQLFWINALIGRCFFDFLRDKWWIGKVTEKLQRKLSKIHVPYFIEELQVTDINMGYEIPGIRHAGKPYIDERGLWIDLSITYSGGFQMTIETKMNLMKLKRTPHASTHVGRSVDSCKSPITDSDEEDSAESSTDEEEELPAHADDSSSGGGASKKLLRYLNKITQSKYFQQATEYKVIKRAMENVSNTPLTLTVTVNSLVGKLALNIPPPPSDRLWYGFRGNPQLRLSAKPQVGERAVTITHIVEWIEKKLAVEFQRVFVMPNMDDLVIPILVPGEVSGVTLSRSMSL